MTDVKCPLPQQFGALTEFDDWCVSSDEARIAKRLDTPFSEVVAFYDAVMPMVPEVMTYLATRPVDNPSIEDINLVNLMKMMAEIANAVEIYHQGPIPDAGDLRNYVSRINRDLVGSDVDG